jgi:hypothetical protein
LRKLHAVVARPLEQRELGVRISRRGVGNRLDLRRRQRARPQRGFGRRQ